MNTLELGRERLLMLLVFQSQGFCPLQLLVHFIPNHSSITEDKHHSGEKQKLEDFPLLSGANPTAHVLHTEHIQYIQFSPKLSLLWALHSKSCLLNQDFAAQMEADPRGWNIIQSQDREKVSHTALFTFSLRGKVAKK